jgi:hypothetical protein
MQLPVIVLLSWVIVEPFLVLTPVGSINIRSESSPVSQREPQRSLVSIHSLSLIAGSPATVAVQDKRSPVETNNALRLT